jgi:hypothetical protein
LNASQFQEGPQWPRKESVMVMRQWLIDVISGGVKRNNGSGSAQNALNLGGTVSMSVKMSRCRNNGQYAAQDALDSEITDNARLKMPQFGMTARATLKMPSILK